MARESSRTLVTTFSECKYYALLLYCIVLLLYVRIIIIRNFLTFQ